MKNGGFHTTGDFNVSNGIVNSFPMIFNILNIIRG